MRFFATVAALALAATVSAQNSTTSATSVAQATSVESSTTTASLTPQQTCLAACGDSDICCQAACVGVPCPSQLDANATTECASKCFQGNGTADETAAYAKCQASCVSSYFLTTTGAPSAAATGASATGSETFSFGGSETASRTASSTGSGSSSSASGNAAPETRAAIAGAGLFGLIIAGLAL